MFGGQILQTVPKFDVYGLFHLSRQLLPHVSRNTCIDFHFSDYMHHYVYIHYYAFWLSPLFQLIGTTITYSVILYQFKGP